jgi:ribosomal protein S18 acetylase RimI-like enzyme
MQHGEGDIRIRPARADDVDAMVAITAEVFAPNAIEAHIERMIGPGDTAGWAEVKAADLRRELAAAPDASFVAEQDGRVVGYVTTVIHRLASRGVIANLAVSAAAQGRGVGRSLLLRSIEHFRRLGLRQAKIETLACNEVGQHLYPSVGFREVVRQIHYVMPLEDDDTGHPSR